MHGYVGDVPARRALLGSAVALVVTATTARGALGARTLRALALDAHVARLASLLRALATGGSAALAAKFSASGQRPEWVN